MTLTDALEKYNISLPKGQVHKLEEYCGLLWAWNERINLTRHTDYEKFAARDVLDSLALAEFLRKNETVLDVGSGGGVPGIILAIVRPDLEIELCDSTGKKALALSEMAQELRLDVIVHHAKAEELLAQKGRQYAVLTIRAVARLKQLLQKFAPYWSSFDRMLLVKGPNWIAERGEARHYNLMSAKRKGPQEKDLMQKIALRCLKKYQSPISESESAESVILQLCLKEDLDNIMAASK